MRISSGANILLKWSAPAQSNRKAISEKSKKKVAPEESTAKAAREENMKKTDFTKDL